MAKKATRMKVAGYDGQYTWAVYNDQMEQLEIGTGYDTAEAATTAAEKKYPKLKAEDHTK